MSCAVRKVFHHVRLLHACTISFHLNSSFGLYVYYIYYCSFTIIYVVRTDRTSARTKPLIGACQPCAQCLSLSISDVRTWPLFPFLSLLASIFPCFHEPFVRAEQYFCHCTSHTAPAALRANQLLALKLSLRVMHCACMQITFNN